MEVEELMQQRPLQLHLGSVSTTPRANRLCDTVRQKGVAKYSSALSEQTAQELLKFMRAPQLPSSFFVHFNWSAYSIG